MTAPRDIAAAVLKRLRAWVSGWLRRFDPSGDDDDEPFATDRSRRRSSSTHRRPTSLFNAPQPVLPPPPVVSSIPRPELEAAAAAAEEAEPQANDPFPEDAPREGVVEQIQVELSGEARRLTPEEMSARAQDARSTEIMDPVPIRRPPMRRSVTERTVKKDTEITARMPKRATARLQRLMQAPDPEQLEALQRQQQAAQQAAQQQQQRTTERRRRTITASDVIPWPGKQPPPGGQPVDRLPPPPTLPMPTPMPPLEEKPPPTDQELGDRSMNYLFNQRHADGG